MLVNFKVNDSKFSRDIFKSYSTIKFDGLKIVDPDTRDDFTGIYVCGLNSEYCVNRHTNYMTVDNIDSPLYWLDYGVCDNASQVLDYFDELNEIYKAYMNSRKFVVLMTPILKSNQPESCGWRWRKWGSYIGKFEPMHEYLYDEEDIDYVFVFKILEVIEKGDDDGYGDD